MISPLDVGPAATGQVDITKPSTAPVKSCPEPFSNWSIEELYAFYRQNLQAAPDAETHRYSAFTFLILDEESAKDKSLLMCCDAPDWGEKADDAVLKSLRVSFSEAGGDISSFEFLSMTPSELRKDGGLLVEPNPWMDQIVLEDGTKAMMFGTPARARRRKRDALLDADLNGSVDRRSGLAIVPGTKGFMHNEWSAAGASQNPIHHESDD